MSRIAAATGLAAAGLITFDLSAHIERLQSEQRSHRDKADEIVARVTTEDRDFTKDEETALADHQGKIVSIGKRVEALRKQAEVRAPLEQPGESRTQPKNVRPGERASGGGTGAGDEDADAKATSDAFRMWIRGGMPALNDEQRGLMMGRVAALPDTPEARDLSAITGNLGGFTVPQGFVAQVEVAMKNFDGVRQAPTGRMPTATGNDLPWPTVNDTTQTGERIGENTAVANQDVAFGQVTFKAFIYSSKSVLVPLTLLQDSGVNVETLLAGLLGQRIGRIQNTEFTTGTGTAQPQGIVTFSTLGKTAAAAAAITYDEVVDLEHSVDPAYRGATAGFMFHDTTLAVLRKLKDSDGRPIWMPAANAGMANGAPGLLNGRPYHINMSMAVPGTGNKSMIFGDLSKYVIRDCRDMILVRLTERYAEKLQVGFFAFMRSDARGVDAGTNPIKHLIHP